MERGVAVVTGGTGGIGTAISRRLAKDYHVIACYFKAGRHDEAMAWQQAQTSAGFDIEIAYADVTSFADCEQLVNQINERFGHIEVLVNNAGITRDAALKKMTLAQWDEVLATNLTSVFNITHHVLPLMLAKNYGRIISIASINGRKGQFGQCNYAASKAGLLGFTKSLALEVAKYNITANTIAPGYIATPMLTSLKPEILDQIVQQIPMGRLGTPEEIADAVAFLAAPNAAFITGANLDINGGQYM